MKFKKCNIDIMSEALNNDSCFEGTKGHLIGSYIGTVEVVTDIYYDYECGKFCDTEIFLAAQLLSGEIVGIDNNKVFKLGYLSIIHWGMFPIGFPEEKKTKRPCPKALLPFCSVPVEEISGNDADDIDDIFC